MRRVQRCTRVKGLLVDGRRKDRKRVAPLCPCTGYRSVRLQLQAGAVQAFQVVCGNSNLLVEQVATGSRCRRVGAMYVAVWSNNR